MKDHLRIGRWLAVLAVVVGILTAGAVTAEAAEISGSKDASKLTAGESYTLTGDTVINMDTDLTVKSIRDVNVTKKYSLTLTGSHTLTVEPASGSGIEVKTLKTSNVGLIIRSESGSVDRGLSVYGDIDINGGKIDITVDSGIGIWTANNCSVSITDSNVIIESHDDCIRANKNLTIVGGTVDATSSNNRALRCANNMVINGATVTATGFNNGLSAYIDVTISGSTVKATGKKDNGIQSEHNGKITITDSTVTAVSEAADAIRAKGGVTVSDESDLTADGYTCGIVTMSDINLENSKIKASASEDAPYPSAIKASAGKIQYKDSLYIKVPDNGRVVEESGASTVKKDGKTALSVEFAKATKITEIRYEFSPIYDGDTITTDFKVTSVPAGAVKNDMFVAFYKDIEKNGDLSTRFAVSDDNKKYTGLKKTDTKYEIGKYYGTKIPSLYTILLILGITADPEDTSTALFDRNIAQYIDGKYKVYCNGVEMSKATVDGWFTIGQCLGSIKKAKIDDIAAQEYTGKAITPEPAVTYNGKTLKKGTDYTLTYKSNTGDPKQKTNATVTVTGKGSYALSANKTFTIEHTKHVKGEGKVAKEPTTEAVGTREFCCTICGKVLETEEIAKLEAPSTADAPLSPENAISLKKAEKALKKVTGYKDPKTAKFGLLQAKAKKVGKNYVTLGWTKVKGAEYYVIYGNKCSKKNKYLKLTTAKASAKSKKIKKIAGKKLKKGTYYKFIIAAVAKDSKGEDKVIACSTSVHFITKGNAKYGDFTKVRLKSKKSVSLKVGKTHKIKATQVKPKNLKVQQHRKLSYESNNKAVATVSRKGKVKGISKGKAIIYVYAQNGIFAKVNVTVE